MKPYNEQEYNQLCVDFIELKCHEPSGYWTLPTFMDGDGWTMNDMKFHSDWNWIMEVKNKICQLNLIDEFNTSYDSVAKGWHCQLLPAYKNSFSSFYSKIVSTEKEATIQAIWEFLQWYNEQKQ
jgi:hypothetical protein